MPIFRDFIESDLDVFINSDEFATDAIIEDEEVVVTLDNDSLNERKLNNRKEGLHTEELFFFVKKSDLTFYPRPDNQVEIDGDHWYVTNVDEDEGLFEITVKLVGS